MTIASNIASDFSSFAIGFDHRDRQRLHELIDRILDSVRSAAEGQAARNKETSEP